MLDLTPSALPARIIFVVVPFSVLALIVSIIIQKMGHITKDC